MRVIRLLSPKCALLTTVHVSTQKTFQHLLNRTGWNWLIDYKVKTIPPGSCLALGLLNKNANTVDGWNPADQLGFVVYPIIPWPKVSSCIIGGCLDFSHPQQLQTFMNTKTVLLELNKRKPLLISFVWPSRVGWWNWASHLGKTKLLPSHPSQPSIIFLQKLRTDGYVCSDMFGEIVDARLLTDRRTGKNEKNNTQKNMSCLAQALAWTSRRNLITLTAAGLLQCRSKVWWATECPSLLLYTPSPSVPFHHQIDVVQLK